ncbi:MAG TPA: HNH endonuclease [Solirubrobacterales bacterium]
MRACLDCARPVAKGNRCPDCKRKNAARRKAEGRTGERGSTYASRRRREETLEAANYRCHYCGIEGASIEDHYIPLEKGGADDSSNTVAACQHCNSRKGSSMPQDFLASDWLRERRKAVVQRRVAG